MVSDKMHGARRWAVYFQGPQRLLQGHMPWNACLAISIVPPGRPDIKAGAADRYYNNSRVSAL